jgi:hypothetical protein
MPIIFPPLIPVNNEPLPEKKPAVTKLPKLALPADILPVTLALPADILPVTLALPADILPVTVKLASEPTDVMFGCAETVTLPA